MRTIRDWQQIREWWIRLLEKQTGESLDTWNERVRAGSISDESGLRAWLSERGVTGYARSLLVMERFGYPDFLLATAEELVEAQYAKHPYLRPIYDAIITAAGQCGKIIIQTRKTYVSLVAPRRTFARIQPSRRRVVLGFRLERLQPSGRLEPSYIHHTMRLQVRLTAPDEVDDQVQRWLEMAYQENS